MNDKALSTRLIHNGDGQYYKKMASYQSIPEVLPIYNTSVFAFDDVPSVDAIYDHEAEGYIYSRIRHPNSDAVSEILASADEGEDALVFSSGMSAIVISVLSVVSPGDHILSSPVLYGGVHGFFQNELKRFGIDVTFVDFNAEDIEKYIKVIETCRVQPACDPAILNIIAEEIPAYFADQKDISEVCKSINNRAQTVLDEKS